MDVHAYAAHLKEQAGKKNPHLRMWQNSVAKKSVMKMANYAKKTLLLHAPDVSHPYMEYKANMILGLILMVAVLMFGQLVNGLGFTPTLVTASDMEKLHDWYAVTLIARTLLCGFLVCVCMLTTHDLLTSTNDKLKVHVYPIGEEWLSEFKSFKLWLGVLVTTIGIRAWITPDTSFITMLFPAWVAAVPRVIFGWWNGVMGVYIVATSPGRTAILVICIAMILGNVYWIVKSKFMYLPMALSIGMWFCMMFLAECAFEPYSAIAKNYLPIIFVGVYFVSILPLLHGYMPKKNWRVAYLGFLILLLVAWNIVSMQFAFCTGLSQLAYRASYLQTHGVLPGPKRSSTQEFTDYIGITAAKPQDPSYCAYSLGACVLDFEMYYWNKKTGILYVPFRAEGSERTIEMWMSEKATATWESGQISTFVTGVVGSVVGKYFALY